MVLDIVGGSLLFVLGVSELVLLIATRRRSVAERELRRVPRLIRHGWFRSISYGDAQDVPTSFLMALVQRPSNSRKFSSRAIISSWLMFSGVALLLYGIFHLATLASVVVGSAVATSIGMLLRPQHHLPRSTEIASALLEERGKRSPRDIRHNEY
jgi:pilus assembly protein TadC